MESCRFLGRVLPVRQAKVKNYQLAKRNLVDSYESYRPKE